MMVGDLVHVVIDNAHQGVGLVVVDVNDFWEHVNHYRVLLDGSMLSVFAYEMEVVDEEGT